MLTQTSELAIKSLLLLGLEGNEDPLSPRPLAERLDCSPSYLAKIFGLLVKAGILRSVRGAHGGVMLGRKPEDITLLDVVEACQGLLIGNYCSEIAEHKDPVCAYHEAMREVHITTTNTLRKWTLADLLKRPTHQDPEQAECCKMFFEGCQKYFAKSGGKSAKKK